MRLDAVGRCRATGELARLIAHAAEISVEAAERGNTVPTLIDAACAPRAAASGVADADQ